MNPIITLTTDFGTRDAYVAEMKGVILSRCPGASIHDLTHEIGPCDVMEGALFLAGCLHRFPEETIHVAVVDPGVGTAQFPLVVRVSRQVVLCPDNGLLTLVEGRTPLDEVRAITHPAFTLESVSATFHGRDIFAAAAGHIAAGARPEEAGDRVDTWVRLNVPEAHREDGGRIVGEILHVDRFGNLITNIDRAMIDGRKNISMNAGALQVRGLVRTYGDAPAETLVALIGSSGYLEIAVNRGHASEVTGMAKGGVVVVDP